MSIEDVALQLRPKDREKLRELIRSIIPEGDTLLGSQAGIQLLEVVEDFDLNLSTAFEDAKAAVGKERRRLFSKEFGKKLAEMQLTPGPLKAVLLFMRRHYPGAYANFMSDVFGANQTLDPMCPQFVPHLMPKLRLLFQFGLSEGGEFPQSVEAFVDHCGLRPLANHIELQVAPNGYELEFLPKELQQKIAYIYGFDLCSIHWACSSGDRIYAQDWPDGFREFENYFLRRRKAVLPAFSSLRFEVSSYLEPVFGSMATIDAVFEDEEGATKIRPRVDFRSWTLRDSPGPDGKGNELCRIAVRNIIVDIILSGPGSIEITNWGLETTSLPTGGLVSATSVGTGWSISSGNQRYLTGGAVLGDEDGLLVVPNDFQKFGFGLRLSMDPSDIDVHATGFPNVKDLPDEEEATARKRIEDMLKAAVPYFSGHRSEKLKIVARQTWATK